MATLEDRYNDDVESKTKQMAKDADGELKKESREIWKRDYKILTANLKAQERLCRNAENNLENHMTMNPDIYTGFKSGWGKE